jgi:deazaflavin-dependent oxidoreductase (nitroreductase family)
MAWLPAGARQAWITTTGRRSGRPHTVPLWFVARGEDGPLYLWHCRGRTDWVANVRASGRLTLDFGGGRLLARAVRIDGAERDWARDAFHRKYLGARLFQLLGWSRRATVFRVEAATGP